MVFRGEPRYLRKPLFLFPLISLLHPPALALPPPHLLVSPGSKVRGPSPRSFLAWPKDTCTPLSRSLQGAARGPCPTEPLLCTPATCGQVAARFSAPHTHGAAGHTRTGAQVDGPAPVDAVSTPPVPPPFTERSRLCTRLYVTETPDRSCLLATSTASQGLVHLPK